MALFTLVVVADPNGFVYIGYSFVDSNADPNGRGASREWVEKLVIVGYPKAATSVHITGNTCTYKPVLQSHGPLIDII